MLVTSGWRNKRRYRVDGRNDGFCSDRLFDRASSQPSNRHRRFQEADTSGITLCTKHNYLCKSSASLQANVEEAFHVARSGRPGPVVIDLPKDVELLDAPFVEGGVLSANKQRYQPRIKPAAGRLKRL